jgi:hypothetical protein
VRRLLTVAVLAAALPSCGVSGLSFVQDHRVSILSPDDRAEVTLPVTIDWEAKDFDGTYAVFVDRAPVPGGKTLEWLARNDDYCKDTPGCPDEQWFVDRNVYVTDKTQLTLERLPELNRDEQRETHEVTIVLLDRDGRRVGESAFGVELRVAGEG